MNTFVSLPDVTGLDVFDAAMEYAANGIPVAPFDPARGKGKSCWNLVGYREVTTSTDVLCGWREQFGPFKALATSPGQFGCVVIDVDRPQHTPRHLRKHLAAAVYINTRPQESPNRGHYWFRLPQGLRLGNPTLPFGEVRCVGGGIVLPPYADRRVVRAGPPPAIPEELASYLTTHVVQAEAGVVVGGTTLTVGQFCTRYKDNARPHKIAAVVKLHQVLLDRGRSPHDAMREALKVGLAEARISYVPARTVIRTLREYWDRDRGEFSRLVQWAIDVAENSNAEQLQLKSDRCSGTDSREYA
ncbi:bifunctional DNA primase/polymerase [Mycobacterium intracellulare]|uniref:bifunctional DNA primase/polymerase n=1 Tax=Mycobacterium intracellulare TaxID=1767 RepID=UPI001CDA576C|nr:bifunctional DNA primase/polymerase [Mycobacterium intracellulare]